MTEGARSPTAFVGRAAELAELRRLAATEQLVTVLGPGGAGTTRLVVEALPTLRPLGVGVVELAACVAGDDLWSVVLDACGIRDDPALAPPERFARRVGDVESVLVLDNCEHVRDPAARAVVELVRACPRLRVVATSRVSLGVPGEATLTVEGLPEDDAAALFLDRARRVQPALAGGADTDRRARRIARALDGLPLAVELAAARARGLPLATIEEGMADRLTFVSTRSGAGRAARHHSLHNCLAWSTALLGERSRAGLAALAVVEGRCSLGAAEAVIGPPGHPGEAGAVAVLEELVDHSLVRFLPDDGAYLVLETVRAHARRTAPGEAGAPPTAGLGRGHPRRGRTPAGRRRRRPAARPRGLGAGRRGGRTGERVRRRRPHRPHAVPRRAPRRGRRAHRAPRRVPRRAPRPGHRRAPRAVPRPRRALVGAGDRGRGDRGGGPRRGPRRAHARGRRAGGLEACARLAAGEPERALAAADRAREQARAAGAVDAGQAADLARCVARHRLGGDTGDVLAEVHEVLSAAHAAGYAPLVVDALDVLAGLVLHAGRAEPAVRLQAAATAARVRLGFARSPVTRDMVDSAAAMDSLEPEIRDRARTEGASLDLDAAVAYARRARGRRRRPASGWDGLTPTERDVVALVARGLRNQAIADELLMGTGTVRTHLRRIFAKLDLTSRAELGALRAREHFPSC